MVSLENPARGASKTPPGEQPSKSRTEMISWEEVDTELFEKLRELRRSLATECQIPPYIILSDATLRELARVRPTTPEKMRRVTGISEAKLLDFGSAFLKLIAAHCSEMGQRPT